MNSQPQGSVLGPLLFNIYINDIFLLMNGTEICNYADDTTLYSCDYEVRNVITRLEQDANRLTAWSPENYMKLNEDKCHFIFLGLVTKELIFTLEKPRLKKAAKRSYWALLLIRN